VRVSSVECRVSSVECRGLLCLVLLVGESPNACRALPASAQFRTVHLTLQTTHKFTGRTTAASSVITLLMSDDYSTAASLLSSPVLSCPVLSLQAAASQHRQV
jgi:hypothetical protein